MRIIKSSNFDKDYYPEEFLNVGTIYDKELAQKVADAINKACSSPNVPDYWRVVENDYVLQKGFEP